jgi:hypothetical protein
MLAAIANPYVNLELKIPKQYSEDFEKYTGRFKTEDGSAKDIDRSPFDLYLDFWWVAIAVGVCEGRVSNTEDLKRIVTGVVLSQDPWRITDLELLAIAHTGTPDVIGRPGEVIDIANGYAATGLPILVEMLLKKSEPIWDVSNYLRKLAESHQPQAAAASE